MANINKISGINVSSILKVRGIDKTALSKAKGRPFGSSSSSPSGEGTFLEELSDMAFPYVGGSPAKADFSNGILNTYGGNRFAQVNQSGVPSIDTSATSAAFSMWFYPVSTRTGLYSNNQVPTARLFGLLQYSTTDLRVASPISGGSIDLTNNPISLEAWNHVVVSFSSDLPYSSTSSKNMTIKVHLNGVEVSSQSGSSTKVPRRNANDGKHVFGANNYNGSISNSGEVSFDFVEWVDNVSLTDSQIQTMYNNGVKGYSIADVVS